MDKKIQIHIDTQDFEVLKSYAKSQHLAMSSLIRHEILKLIQSQKIKEEMKQ